MRRLTGTMGVPNRRRLRQFYETILATLRKDFTPSSAWCFTRRGHGSDEYIVSVDNYVGVGSGAFSYLDGTLYSTSFSLQGYEQRVRRGLSGIVACHRLGEIDRMRYTLLVRMFGLRLDRNWALARKDSGNLQLLGCNVLLDIEANLTRLRINWSFVVDGGQFITGWLLRHKRLTLRALDIWVVARLRLIT